MFRHYYDQYKLYFWGILTLLFTSGAISNNANGTMFEVILNGALGGISLLIFIFLLVQKVRK